MVEQHGKAHSVACRIKMRDAMRENAKALNTLHALPLSDESHLRTACEDTTVMDQNAERVMLRCDISFKPINRVRSHCTVTKQIHRRNQMCG